MARFIGAGSAEEIIFVRGATEAINLVAKSWGKQNIGEGDEIVVSLLEHHANIVPWQELARENGARIRVIPVDDKGQILLDEYQRLLNDRTKLVAISQVSNALGTVTPVKEIVELAHRVGASVLSFILAGYHPEEVVAALNQEGIAVRAGHHCAQPILRRFGVEATVRPSLAFYNTCAEVDLLVSVLLRLARGKGRAVS